ncbi:MAG: DUF4259 domain-containing protein [Erythrobacter sp.]|nr:DUF4259 domain-containing protein [Erythrobacter sp.]
MGVWGTGSFENDDALDFAAEIQSAEDLANEVRLHDVGATLEVERACRVIVVGECVAAMRGHRHESMPDELAERVHAFGTPADELFDNARDSVSMVITNSELSDLWAESEDRGEFNRAMTDLIDRLNQPLSSAKKPTKKEGKPNFSPCWICGEEMGQEFTSLSVTLDPESGMSQSGSVHLACLNAALHPRFMIQDWQFDDEMIARLTSDIFGKGEDG